MAQVQKKKRRKSPYVKYSKTPFQYKHRKCEHNHSHYERVPDWRGMVCDACNIITDGPFRDDQRVAA